MNTKPRVFISAVSSEFKTARDKVAHTLQTLGFDPVQREVFGTEGGDLREVLKEKIDSCQGLIQIVGEVYGFEPPVVDPDYGRVSYTQFELLYARTRSLKTWLLIADRGARRDTPIEAPDRAAGSPGEDLVSDRAERQGLQVAYVDARKRDGYVYYTYTSDIELENAVLKTRDSEKELRADFQRWQGKVVAGSKWARAGLVVSATILLALGVADVFRSGSLMCRVPGIHRLCGLTGLGGVATALEEQLWQSRRAGDCGVLRTYLVQFPRGAYASEANRRLAAVLTTTPDEWLPDGERKLPLEVRTSETIFPTKAAAIDDAHRRSGTEAQALCEKLYGQGEFRLAGTATAGMDEPAHCALHDSGFVCRLSGYATCKVARRFSAEICP